MFGFIRRTIGLDSSLFQRFPQRFCFKNEDTEIAPGVFLLTRIGKQHPAPKGNRYLYVHSGHSSRLDDFEHELILVVREGKSLVAFTGCSHHGILNILDAVMENFPGWPIKAVFGGLHLIGLPLFNSMAESKDDVEKLGRSILHYPIEKIYTGHCTGEKAFRILSKVIGDKLQKFTTGSQVEIEIQ